MRIILILFMGVNVCYIFVLYVVLVVSYGCFGGDWYMRIVWVLVVILIIVIIQSSSSTSSSSASTSATCCSSSSSVVSSLSLHVWIFIQELLVLWLMCYFIGVVLWWNVFLVIRVGFVDIWFNLYF